MDEGIKHTLRRASSWPKKSPLVAIEAFTLLPNHFHLLLKELEEGGVTRFMHKLGTGMVNYANAKYKEKGSMFQGPYRSRTISADSYFRYVAAYVMVKNTFELFPEGFEKAVRSFEVAWKWATRYPYSSFGHYAGASTSPILASPQPFLQELFPKPNEFKSFARDFSLGRADIPLVRLENELEEL